MSVEVVFWSVVLARFALPLLIPRFPLPAIIACLLLDGVDQTIFQTFGFDPPNYQSYDKAMDVFYLSVAYLASLRTGPTAAVKVSRFLFFYRQIGVVAFELTGAAVAAAGVPEHLRVLLHRLRRRSAPGGTRCATRFKFWVLVAGAIWIFVKLPQEYWIHIAQLDLTDTIRDVPWFLPVLVVAVLALLAVLWFVVRPRLPPADWPLRLARRPAAGRDRRGARAGRVPGRAPEGLRLAAVEKIFLIGLISVIYGRVLPGVEASDLQLFLGIAVFVVINSAIGLWSARRGYGVGLRGGLVRGRLRDERRTGRPRRRAAVAADRRSAAGRHAVLRLPVQHPDHAVRPVPPGQRLPRRRYAVKDDGVRALTGRRT